MLIVRLKKIILVLYSVFILQLFTPCVFSAFDDFNGTSWNMQGAFSSGCGVNEEGISSPPQSDWTNHVLQFFRVDNGQSDVVALQEAGAVPGGANRTTRPVIQGAFRVGTLYPYGDHRNRTFTSEVAEYTWNGYYLYHMVIDITRRGMRCNIAIVSRTRAYNMLMFPPTYEQNRAPHEVTGLTLPRVSTRPVLGIELESPYNNERTVFWSMHASSHPYNEVPRFLSALDFYHDQHTGFQIHNYTDLHNDLVVSNLHSYTQSFAVFGDFNRNIAEDTDNEARNRLGVPADMALIRTDQHTHFNSNGVYTELDAIVTADFSMAHPNDTNAMARLGGGAVSDHGSIQVSAVHCNQRCTEAHKKLQQKTFVTLYQHSYYNGYRISLEPGNYALSELRKRGMINDDISSIKIPDGYMISVYQHDGFGGWRDVYTKSINWVGYAHNDQISSVKVRRVPPVELYQHSYYRGYVVNLGLGSYSLADLKILGMRNDDISSIKVKPGYKLTAYQHDGFGGWHDRYTKDTPWVGHAHNDQISSVKIEKR